MIHKTGQIISLDENARDEIVSESEEFAELCKTYESKIGFLREDDEARFDEELAKIMVDEAKKIKQERVKEITNVFKECVLSEKTKGIMCFGGYVLNAREFSGVKIDTFDVSVKKEM